jgi:tetratricopeptide (TPR) repeat protein
LTLSASQAEVEASCRSDLAALLLAQNRKHEAAEMLTRAIELAPPGQARARMLTNLGTLNWRLGKTKEAEARLRQALDEMEGAVGPRHPDVARVLDDYSVVLAKTGRKEESRATAKRARDLRSAFGWQANAGRGSVDWHDLR